MIDAALCRVDKTATDLVTVDPYDNFVLELDYKVPKDANSGIIYRVSEDQGATWMTGIECQILDNTNAHGDAQKSGWAYSLYTNRRPIPRQASRSMPPSRSASGTTSSWSATARTSSTG